MRFKTYTGDPAMAAAGTGVYTAADWGESRSEGHLKRIGENPSDDRYRELVHSAPFAAQRISVNRLLNEFDFGRFTRLGELGGCPYVQSWTIKQRYPGIAMTVSDLDSASNALLRTVPAFADIRIVDINLKSDDLSPLADCDIVTSWNVEYALEDSDIERLLRYFAARRAVFLLCSAQVKPLYYGLRTTLGHMQRRIVGTPDRMHGWIRTRGHIIGLAERSGYRIDRQKDLGFYQVFFLAPA